MCAEFNYFKIKPSPSAEIITLLVCNNNALELNKIYSVALNSNLAVRLHIKKLIDMGLVVEEKSKSDSRAKIIKLSVNGINILTDNLSTHN